MSTANILPPIVVNISVIQPNVQSIMGQTNVLPSIDNTM